MKTVAINHNVSIQYCQCFLCGQSNRQGGVSAGQLRASHMVPANLFPAPWAEAAGKKPGWLAEKPGRHTEGADLVLRREAPAGNARRPAVTDVISRHFLFWPGWAGVGAGIGSRSKERELLAWWDKPARRKG